MRHAAKVAEDSRRSIRWILPRLPNVFWPPVECTALSTFLACIASGCFAPFFWEQGRRCRQNQEKEGRGELRLE